MCRYQHLHNEQQTSLTLFEKGDRLKMAVARANCGTTGSGDERPSKSRYYLRAHKLRSWKRALKSGSGEKDGDFFKNKMAYYLSGNTVFWILSRYKNAMDTTIRNVIIAGYTLFLVESYTARFKLQL